MYLFQLKKIAFTFCLVFAVLTANAAGLGNLNLMSGLGEPLNAEIELLSVKPDELASIQASIASEQAYAEQSLEKPSSHNGIKVTVMKNSRGEPSLKLVSSQPMSDAFLDMLIQVEWSTGRLVKEYTVLLDPPGYEQKLASPSTVKLPAPAPDTEKPTSTPEKNELVSDNGASKPIESNAAEPKPVAKVESSEAKLSTEQLAQQKAKINYKFKKPEANEKPTNTAEPQHQSAPQETHKTVAGDTLYGIARANQPEGVSLEQMLVGLYQANPNAFINHNINQLKVGQVISVPNEQALEKINPTQAKRQYKAQSAHWNTYKNKLAGLVKQSKANAEESNAQQSAGKVVAAEDKSLPVNTGIKDVVKLSAGDAGGKNADKTNAKALQDKVSALQEEITAKDNAVKEAQSRTSDLEKQVSEMQKLLALKNDAMLKLQQNADAVSKELKPADSATQTKQPLPTVATPAAPTPSATTPAIPATDKPADGAEPAKTTESAAVEPPKEGVEVKTEALPNAEVVPPDSQPAKTPLPTPPEQAKAPEVEPAVETPSFFASLMKRFSGIGSLFSGNPLTKLGLLGLPILGAVWWMLRQKRKKNLASFEDGIMSPSVSDMTVNTVFGNTTGGTVDAGDTSFLTDFSQSAVGGMIDANDVDPIAEAEVYMAYGRDAQAEEILKDAIAKEPKRYELHLKLLEIYQASQNNSAFEAIAGELYANLGGNDQNWLKVAQMGLKLDPNNPLYQSAAQVSAKVAPGESSSSEVVAKPAEAQKVADSDYDMLDLNFETPSLDLDIAKSASSEVKKTDDSMSGFGNTIAFGNTISTFDDKSFNDSVSADVVAKSPSLDEMSFGSGDDSKTNQSSSSSTLNTEPTNEAFSLDASDFANTMTPKSLDLPTLDFTSSSKVDEVSVNDSEAQVSKASTTSATLNPTEMFKSVPSLNFDAIDNPSTYNVIEEDAGVQMEVSSISQDDYDATTGPTENKSPASAENTLSAEQSEEVETKLDLIKAYIDMEDVVGAKELIEEVLKEGAASQRQRANELLAQLA